MAIDKELIDKLLADYKGPENSVPLGYRVGTTDGIVDRSVPFKAGRSVFAKNRTLTQFQPRFGLAYQVDDKTVLRLGAGVFHNFRSLTELQKELLDEGPYGVIGIYLGNPLPFPQIPADMEPVAKIICFWEGSKGTLATYQGNLTLERELTPGTKVSASYIINRANHTGIWGIWNTAPRTHGPNGEQYIRPDAPPRFPIWPLSA